MHAPDPMAAVRHYIDAGMTFQMKGRQISQSGAIFTVALRKLSVGWRIAAWAWSKGKNQ